MASETRSGGDLLGLAAIDRQIAAFERLEARAPNLKVTQLAPFAYSVAPKGGAKWRPPGKRFALTIMGLTHGNELAGAGVVNAFADHLAAGTVPLDVEIALVLGNPWAARQNKRFLDRDLNRSFGATKLQGHEGERARVLESVLAESALLVDFHQVTRPIDRSFFIFPFRRAAFRFARAILPWQTVVTHWGSSFSTEGLCSDEFVNGRGGVGISLELGQNGLTAYQVAVGLEASIWALHCATQLLADPKAANAWMDARASANADRVELYTWAAVVPWPAQGVVTLEPGWDNFDDVEVGEKLGTVSGAPLVASHGGKMLFPKYLTPEQQQALAVRPTELCRIMRRIGVGELPTDR